MTEYLYMLDEESNYIKEFEATVRGAGEGFVVLDKSAFYPLGGGQPTDKGTLEWDGGKVTVREVRKKGGQHMLGDVIFSKHAGNSSSPSMIDGNIPVGTKVKGVLDWDRRYGHMKMHTAQHIVSGIVYEMFGARTVGNQIHADRSRIDFGRDDFTDEDIKIVEEKCNEAFSTDTPIRIYEMERSALEEKVGVERANLDLIPEFISVLRVIDIDKMDICPCAGTHVRNTNEIGSMKITSKKSKGAGKIRVEYVLE